jgi:hypothetical protein
MSPVELAKYLLISVVLIVPLFFGISLLRISQDRCEDYREWLRPFIHVSHAGLRRACMLTGGILFAIGLLVLWLVGTYWDSL